MANKEAYKNGLQTQFRSGGNAAVKAGRAGGLATAEANRQLATLREAFAAAMTGEDRLGIYYAMRDRALAGDVKAAVFIRDTMGEKPVDKIEQAVNEIAFRVEGVSEAEADLISG